MPGLNRMGFREPGVLAAPGQRITGRRPDRSGNECLAAVVHAWRARVSIHGDSAASVTTPETFVGLAATRLVRGQAGAGARATPRLLFSHTIVVMTRKNAPSVRTRKQVPAAVFKAHCLELMDVVRESGAVYVVTKHGRPVARLVPYDDPDRKALFGSMKGTVLKYERPLEPIEADYDLDRD